MSGEESKGLLTNYVRSWASAGRRIRILPQYLCDRDGKGVRVRSYMKVVAEGGGKRTSVTLSHISNNWHKSLDAVVRAWKRKYGD